MYCKKIQKLPKNSILIYDEQDFSDYYSVNTNYDKIEATSSEKTYQNILKLNTNKIFIVREKIKLSNSKLYDSLIVEKNNSKVKKIIVNKYDGNINTLIKIYEYSYFNNFNEESLTNIELYRLCNEENNIIWKFIAQSVCELCYNDEPYVGSYDERLKQKKHLMNVDIKTFLKNS